MKKILLFSTSIFVIILISCKVQNKVKSEFPIGMQEPVLSEYVKLFNRGKVFYDINCAKCHNVKIKNRELYPDFSSEELSGYDIRILNPKHEDDLTERQVTEEEIAIIKTFLAYKKKNNDKVNAKFPIKTIKH